METMAVFTVWSGVKTDTAYLLADVYIISFQEPVRRFGKKQINFGKSISIPR